MKVCLTMIVKDEAPIIGRCLASVLPWVSSYAIVDTGSTDDTMALMHGALSGLPGGFANLPWLGFAESRNNALRIARVVAKDHGADALLMMDADHVLHVDGEFPELVHDVAQVEHRYGTLSYTLPILMRPLPSLRYEMPVHEFLTADGPFTQGRYDGMWVEVHSDGARSRNPEKFADDAAALSKFLIEHPRHARAAYYYAQSERDAGELEEARRAYRFRASLPGWPEETWSALYEAAKLTERMGGDPEVVSRDYLIAYQARPSRAEPLVALARYHRQRDEMHLAALYAQQAVTITATDDRLFVEHDCYTWRAADEMSVAGFYGSYRQRRMGRTAAKKLIVEKRFPPSEESRIRQNRDFYA